MISILHSISEKEAKNDKRKLIEKLKFTDMFESQVKEIVHPLPKVHQTLS
jgi:hypothetical protein